MLCTRWRDILFPDTYFITDKEPTIEGVTEMMLDRMDTVLSEREAIEASGFSVNEFLSLASIVCKRRRQQSERSQSHCRCICARGCGTWVWRRDVTVLHITMKTELIKRSKAPPTRHITRESSRESPGPICATPVIDMDAVLNYEKTDDLFFYAGPDGTVYYAKTVEEHNANVAAHPWSDDLR